MISDLARRSFLRFKLAAVLDEVAFGQRNIPRDLCADFIDDRTEIPICNIGLDNDPPLHVFSVDRVRPLIDTDFRNLTDRDLGSGGRVDQSGCNGLDGLAGGIVEPHNDVVGALIFQNLRNRLAVECDVDGLGQIVRAQPDRAAARRSRLI